MSPMFGGLSVFADKLDFYTLVLTAVCAFITIGVFIAMMYFSWKYHHSRDSHGKPIQSYKLEIGFALFTFIGFMAFFVWATHLYKEEVSPKKEDYEIFVYGKRWMWKFYHPNGVAEVNHLHIPKDKNVKLVMISKDIIHSFFIPGFRIKQDVLPGMYTFLNLNGKKLGTYPLYCAEYCGSYHSRMTGEVSVIEEADYQNMIKLEKGPQGKVLFEKQGCLSCHNAGHEIAPALKDLAKNHSDDFLRRSILYPQESVEKGYEAVMPSYLNVVSEEEIRFLIQYIRSAGTK